MTICLPLTALWWYPEEHGNGPRRISVPDGLPIHATMTGRVTSVDSQAVGTVVIRDEEERFHHYRRLQSSSITVSEHDVVAGGQILGVVAAPSDDSMPFVFYGVQRSDDTWVDVVDLLLGATDPADLGLRPDLVERSTTAPRQPASAPAPAPDQESAPKSARVRAREAASRTTAAVGQDPTSGVAKPTGAAPRPEPPAPQAPSTEPPSPGPSSTGPPSPASEPAPASPDVPAPEAQPVERPRDTEPEEAAPPKRSPLAARRPRRGTK